MKIKPLDDRIVIRPLDAEAKTKGGIVLPDTAKEKQQQGKVVAVGEGKLLKNGQRASLTVKKGDRVIYGKFSGNEIKIADVDYIIMKESEVLSLVE